MRFALFLLLAAPLCAQPAEGTDFIDMGADVIPYYVKNYGGEPVLVGTVQYSWSITRDSEGTKVFTFAAKACNDIAIVDSPFIAGGSIYVVLPVPNCYTLTKSQAEALAPIAAAITEFYNYHPNAPHDAPDYNPQPPAIPPPPIQPHSLTHPQVAPQLTTATPLTPANPQMIFLDGLSQNLIRFDLTAQAVTATVVVPSTSGPLGVRPVSTGAAHEVWTANGLGALTVADLSTQKVVATITPASLPGGTASAIAFTPDGATGFETVNYFSPDANGNRGAMVVFDAINRKTSSVFPLKNGSTAMVVAPDGYTVYLVDANGTLTYYDVLSGTADLSVSTFTPGQAGAFQSGPLFISPDGTHLYGNNGTLILGFDLTTRKMTTMVSSGLPTTSQVTMYMSQDGLRIWLTSVAGTVAAYDVLTGGVLGTFTTDQLSALYMGPAH